MKRGKSSEEWRGKERAKGGPRFEERFFLHHKSCEYQMTFYYAKTNGDIVVISFQGEGKPPSQTTGWILPPEPLKTWVSTFNSFLL